MWNSHNSLPVPDLTLTITWKRLDDYHFLLKWYFGFFDWTDSFTQPSTASRNYFHTRNWNHDEMMDTCTCYPTKWTSLGNNVSVKTANSTTNKRTSFSGCVAMKKLIIREYIYIYIYNSSWKVLTYYTIRTSLFSQNERARLCFVWIIRVWALQFVRWKLSRPAFSAIVFIRVLTSISLALDQLLSDFFCSIISTQSAFGLFMDFGLSSE